MVSSLLPRPRLARPKAWRHPRGSHRQGVPAGVDRPSRAAGEPRMSQHFASDNNAGLCPEALEALLAANREGHTAGYGDDHWTKRACDKLRALFETDCAVFLVFSGTAANALALAQLCRSYHAVIAHADSHVA